MFQFDDEDNFLSDSEGVEDEMFSAAEALPEPTPSQITAPSRSEIAEIPPTITRINDTLAIDVALKESTIEQLATAHNITVQDLTYMLAAPSFQQRVKHWEGILSKDGMSMKLKSQFLAESMLPNMYRMASDPRVDPKVRVDIVKWMANVGGVGEKTAERNAGTGGGSGTTVVINFQQEEKATLIIEDTNAKQLN